MLIELLRSATSISVSHREHDTTWSLSTSTESTANVLRGINSAETTVRKNISDQKILSQFYLVY